VPAKSNFARVRDTYFGGSTFKTLASYLYYRPRTSYVDTPPRPEPAFVELHSQGITDDYLIIMSDRGD
jgi:hypothetical protein